MDPVNLASVLVAVVAALAAILSQRAIAKASVINTTTSSRVDMEKEAYDRARSYDTETILRQDKEIDELREDNKRLHSEVKKLTARLVRHEALFPTNIEELLRDLRKKE